VEARLSRPRSRGAGGLDAVPAGSTTRRWRALPRVDGGLHHVAGGLHHVSMAGSITWLAGSIMLQEGSTMWLEGSTMWSQVRLPDEFSRDPLV
jgi:hypothetical protein